MDGVPSGGGDSFFSPLCIFLLVVALQSLDGFLDIVKKKGMTSEEEVQLRKEIKELYKEASSLSTPSTFAQSAKLKRLAAAKEKELLRKQEERKKEKTWLYELSGRALLALKVMFYLFIFLKECGPIIYFCTGTVVWWSCTSVLGSSCCSSPPTSIATFWQSIVLEVWKCCHRPNHGWHNSMAGFNFSCQQILVAKVPKNLFQQLNVGLPNLRFCLIFSSTFVCTMSLNWSINLRSCIHFVLRHLICSGNTPCVQLLFQIYAIFF